MRSAYPAVFLCALACATAPSSARLASTPSTEQAVALASSATAGTASSSGQLVTGSFLTPYFSGETLYDVLRRRAPLYLRSRPNPSSELSGRDDPIAVYINGSFSGSLDVLQSIQAYDVLSVKRMSAGEAAIRFGPKHSGGALLVTLVRHD
jgi:hypothetical protein